MNIKVQYFQSATLLTKFVNNVANAVHTVVAITFDTASGQYVLFYS